MTSEVSKASFPSSALIPGRMTGVLLVGHGGYDKLEFRDDIPVPTVGAGEVLIRVAAAGINNTDINTRIGWYSKSISTGTLPTAQASGCIAPQIPAQTPSIKRYALPASQTALYMTTSTDIYIAPLR